MTTAVQNLAGQIHGLMGQSGMARCDDISRRGVFGYHVRPDHQEGWVTVYSVDDRPGQSPVATHSRFEAACKPLLAAAFGESRVSRVTVKLRVAGKMRPTPGLRVALAG